MHAFDLTCIISLFYNINSTTVTGLTWVFGFLAVSDARLPFQYLFCITNAFQGLVIFLLHNIRDPKVMAWWRRVFHLKPKKIVSATSASSSTYLSSRKTDYSRSTRYTSDRPVTPSKFNLTDKSNSVRSTAPLTNISSDSVKCNVPPAAIETSPKPVMPIANKYLQLEKSKLMHSSTESEGSDSQASSASTANSGV